MRLDLVGSFCKMSDAVREIYACRTRFRCRIRLFLKDIQIDNTVSIRYIPAVRRWGPGQTVAAQYILTLLSIPSIPN
jgi:hypothetical protein